MKKYLISADVQAFYRISPRTLKKWITDGLNFEKAGNAKIFLYEDVEKFVNIDGQVYGQERNFISTQKLANKLGISKVTLDSIDSYSPIPSYERYDGTICYDAEEIISYFEETFDVLIEKGEKPFWRTIDICQHYKVSPETVKRWVKLGLPKFKFNSKLTMFNKKEVDAWLLGSDKESTLNKELFTATEIANEFFSYPDRIRRLCHEGRLKCYVLSGTNYRFTEEQINEFIDTDKRGF